MSETPHVPDQRTDTRPASKTFGIGKLVAREQPVEPQWERIEAGGPPDKIRLVACGGKE